MSEQIWPGDRIQIDVASAPELSNIATVTADGFIEMSPIGRIEAAGLTPERLDLTLERALSTELIDPTVGLTPLGATPSQVFVGGAVGAPGVISLPGEIGPLEAIIMAGDFRLDMQHQSVLLARRLENGKIASVVYDIRSGLANEAFTSWGPLQRFDVIYVSPERITERKGFMRDRLHGILPIDFAIFFGIS